MKSSKNWGQLVMKSKLSSLCSYRKGKIAVSELDSTNYISTENMLADKGGITKSSGLPASDFTQAYYKNDVLVSNIRPYFKKIWFANMNGGCSNDVLVFTTNNECEPSFLYYVLSNDDFFNYATVTAKGTKMPRGDKKAIMEYEVPIYDIDTQKKIASILSVLDDKIEVNQKINENLEQQAQAIFKSWFVDFEPFGGVMPNDWEISCLKDCCSLISRGITPKYSDESEEIVINQKCIRNHQIDITQARTHIPKKINEKWLKHLDILINSTGQGTLGRIAQVYFEPQKMTVDSHVTIIRPKNIHTAYYIGCLLLNSENDFVAMAHGSTGQTELPRELVQSYKFILPNDDIIKSFNDIVEPMFKQIIINQNENSRLCKIRDTLLPKLMNGEIF